MKLIVHELEAVALEQSLTASRNILVEAVRPHIYRHNLPTGSLKVRIRNSSDVLVAESEEVEIADIGSDNFFHGYVRFFINAYLASGQTYKFQLIGTDGYTFGEAAYCGWVNAYDLNKYLLSYVAVDSLRSPLDIEIWERKVK